MSQNVEIKRQNTKLFDRVFKGNEILGTHQSIKS